MSELLEERLRRAAQTYRRLGNHTAESMFIEAADTITELRGALSVASVDYRHLSEENAKLRELMSVMAYCNQFRRDCDGCSLNGAAGIITERAGCDELLARLRERGVVVDE